MNRSRKDLAPAIRRCLERTRAFPFLAGSEGRNNLEYFHSISNQCPAA